jgi:hypothetical protein
MITTNKPITDVILKVTSMMCNLDLTHEEYFTLKEWFQLKCSRNDTGITVVQNIRPRQLFHLFANRIHDDGDQRNILRHAENYLRQPVPDAITSKFEISYAPRTYEIDNLALTCHFPLDWIHWVIIQQDIDSFERTLPLIQDRRRLEAEVLDKVDMFIALECEIRSSEYARISPQKKDFLMQVLSAHIHWLRTDDRGDCSHDTILKKRLRAQKEQNDAYLKAAKERAEEHMRWVRNRPPPPGNW